jgi:hypothetical protein
LAYSETGRSKGKVVVEINRRRHSPHSHSIVSVHRNALIFKRKIFLLTV